MKKIIATYERTDAALTSLRVNDEYADTMNPPKSLKDAVKRAYRKMAIKYHPDKGGNDYMMQIINEHYEVLQAAFAGK